MQYGVEAQKETIRPIDIGAHYLALYLIVTLVRSLLYLTVTFFCSVLSCI